MSHATRATVLREELGTVGSRSVLRMAGLDYLDHCLPLRQRVSRDTWAFHVSHV